MDITVKEFVEKTSGVDGYGIWGGEMDDGSWEHDFFFCDSSHKTQPAYVYERFKNRKIKNFKFKYERDVGLECKKDVWIECILYLQD